MYFLAEWRIFSGAGRPGLEKFTTRTFPQEPAPGIPWDQEDQP